MKRSFVEIVLVLPFLLLLFGCGTSKRNMPSIVAYSSEFNSQDSLSMINGRVFSALDSSVLMIANVVLFRNDTFFLGTQTSMEGNFEFLKIKKGAYSIDINCIGFEKFRNQGLIVKEGQVYNVNFYLKKVKTKGIGCGGHYIVPLIRMDETTSGATFTSDQLKRMAW